MESSSSAENQITPQEVAKRLDSGEIQLVDVREMREWAAGHIAGAIHIELDRLPAEAGSIDKDRPVVFHCRGDGRSPMAADAFRGAGYDASVMEGGLVGWVEQGLPLEPAGGHVAERSLK